MRPDHGGLPEEPKDPRRKDLGPATMEQKDEVRNLARSILNRVRPKGAEVPAREHIRATLPDGRMMHIKFVNQPVASEPVWSCMIVSRLDGKTTQAVEYEIIYDRDENFPFIQHVDITSVEDTIGFLDGKEDDVIAWGERLKEEKAERYAKDDMLMNPTVSAVEARSLAHDIDTMTHLSDDQIFYSRL